MPMETTNLTIVKFMIVSLKLKTFGDLNIVQNIHYLIVNLTKLVSNVKVLGIVKILKLSPLKLMFL